jgi:hypothetical protein
MEMQTFPKIAKTTRIAKGDPVLFEIRQSKEFINGNEGFPKIAEARGTSKGNLDFFRTLPK